MPFGYEVADTFGAGIPYNAGEADPDSPEVVQPAIIRMASRIRKCRDLAAGEEAITAARTRYLPKFPAEDDEDYKFRLEHGELYNGFRRTIKAGVGLVMQTPPALSDDTPPEFTADWENIDGRGTKGAVFATQFTDDAMVTGLAGILVEYPNVAEPRLLDLDSEQALGIRPYWVHVRAENFGTWRFAQVNGQTVLTLLVLRFDVEVSNGRFGTACETHFRVWERQVLETFDNNGMAVDVVSDAVRWELWRKGSGDKRAEFFMGGTLIGMDEIPFAPCVVGNDIDGWECTPPLADLAAVNLAHYRVQTNRNHLMDIGCVPVPVRKGWREPTEGGRTKVGPNTLMDVSENGDFKYAEITGASFGPSEKDLEKKEQRMGALGLSFLAPDTRAAETAEAKRIDATAQNATLSTLAQAVEDCLENAARLHAKWRKLATNPGISVNREFEKIVMDTDAMNAFSDMEAKGQLTLDTLLDVLIKGHRLPPDFDIEGEKTALVLRQQETLALGAGDPNNNPGGKQPPNGSGGA